MKSIKKDILLELLESIKNKTDEKTIQVMFEARTASQSYASTMYGPDIKLDDNSKKPHAQPAPFKSGNTPKEKPDREFSNSVSSIVNTSQYKMKPFNEKELEKPTPKPRKKEEPEQPQSHTIPKPTLKMVDEDEEDNIDNSDTKNQKLDTLAKNFIWEDQFSEPEKRAILTIPKDMWTPFYKRELLLSEEDLITSVTNKDQNMEIRCIDENQKVVYVPFMYLNKYYDVLGTHDIIINGKKYAVVKAVPKIYADDVRAVNYKDNKILLRRKQSDTYAFDLMDSSPFFSIFSKESYDTLYGKIDSVLKELKGTKEEPKKKAPAKPRKKRVKKEESK